MNLTLSKKEVGLCPTPSESLRRKLGLYQPKLKVCVQPIANWQRDNDNGCGLTDHFDGAFKDRMEYISSLDVDIIILTEFNRLLKYGQEEDFFIWMSDFGYELTESYLKDNRDTYAFETMMWNKKSITEEWNLLSAENTLFSHDLSGESTIRNGAVIACFQHIETGKLCNIGAIHNTLLLSDKHSNIVDIVIDEYREMAEKSIQDNVQWFGDLNIAEPLLYLADKRDDLLGFIKSINLVYTDLPDFCCSTTDYISQVVSEFYGGDNVIGERREDGSCRQVTTLCKAAGKNIRLLALLHPVTLENTILMTRSEIAEMSGRLDFNSGCFDHMTCICEVYAE